MITKPVLAVTDLGSVYEPAKKLGGSNAQLSNLINPLIYNILIVSGIFAFLVIIIAGFSYITASGDKGKLEQSQQMLTYGIIGLIVVVVALIITRIVGSVIGFKFI